MEMIAHGATPPKPTARTLIYRVCGRPGRDDRPALAAGHPTSWLMLTGGTCLDGAEYPYPVFFD